MGYPAPPTMLILIALLFFLASPATAFGAGNIASISKVEGQNWRHGDIEDLLKTIAFIKGHKWNSIMMKRVYFGNWLRDYSQAVDVGTLKGVQADTIRILVWVLSFLSFGYATGEFEVTSERLGVYYPAEHIDNPKDYAENIDARQLDSRLRPPVAPIELAVDPNTGMKNYIANDSGGWATSSGFVRHSFKRSLHFGRLYTSGAGSTRGKEADLCEALRCLGQGLHCLEDFGAHTNYTELALRELGFNQVFAHTGTQTQINVRGHQIYPLVTGTFGGVDFLHSVLGELSDNVTQSEVDELNTALGDAQKNEASTGGARAHGGGAASYMTTLLAQIPGEGGSLARQAEQLKADSDAQEFSNLNLRSTGQYNDTRASGTQTFAAPPGSTGGPPGPGVPGLSPDFDPIKTAAQIYPILEFRDRVVRAISATIEKIPGLQALIEKITETLTLFVLSLLAPFIKPIIEAVSKSLKTGSSGVIEASAKQQFGPWNDPHCTDPTHSMLSKDHFSNILNPPAGRVAGAILKYAAPRIIYGWEHPDVDDSQILEDIVRVFHHPALRDRNNELHRKMYEAVEGWVHQLPDQGQSLNNVLGSESVKAGKNHVTNSTKGLSFGGLSRELPDESSHSKVSGSEWERTISRRQLQGKSGSGYDEPYANPLNPYGGGYGTTNYAAPDPYQQGAPGQQHHLPQPDYSGYPPQGVSPYPGAYGQGNQAPPQGGYVQGNQPPPQGSYGQENPQGGYPGGSQRYDSRY
ncbi:MAG: hypothetical protein M1829_000145 [Trizodia sp. TS-e1964]|nr:MAG: hypothetical protein M1829_000145 [Trizodia sp. TS-e1964]